MRKVAVAVPHRVGARPIAKKHSRAWRIHAMAPLPVQHPDMLAIRQNLEEQAEIGLAVCPCLAALRLAEPASVVGQRKTRTPSGFGRGALAAVRGGTVQRREGARTSQAAVILEYAQVSEHDFALSKSLMAVAELPSVVPQEGYSHRRPVFAAPEVQSVFVQLGEPSQRELAVALLRHQPAGTTGMPMEVAEARASFASILLPKCSRLRLAEVLVAPPVEVASFLDRSMEREGPPEEGV
jgi:hypothetical protein